VDVCWGHQTGVTEDNIREFFGNWTGTGTITGSGDNEQIELEVGQWMESEVVDTLGVDRLLVIQNKYQSGDTFTVKWRTAATKDGVLSATWNTYSVDFESLGYCQLRVER
jgi:hypothetical protein